MIIVASVSCIYGLGSPEEYEGQILRPYRGTDIPLEFAMQRLVDIQYQRNNMSRARGTFRVRATPSRCSRRTTHRLPDRVVGRHDREDHEVRPGHRRADQGDIIDLTMFPASHYVAGEERMKRAVVSIEDELEERLATLEARASCSRPNASACAPATTWR